MKTLKTLTRGKTRYALKQTGTGGLELHVLGRHGFMAGHVSRVEGFERAIEAHEEEMKALWADALQEFGY